MWKFNTTTDTWTSIGNPNIPNYGLVTVAFTQGQKGYNVIYNYNLQGYYIYEFDPNTDIWTQKNKSEITGIVWRENVFSYRNKVYLFDSHDNLWYYDEILATFQLKSHIDIGYGTFIVTLNDRVYMIKQTGNVYDIFTYDLENDFTEKFCTLHNNFPNANTTLVVLNSKFIFLTSRQTCLYELDISKLQ